MLAVNLCWGMSVQHLFKGQTFGLFCVQLRAIPLCNLICSVCSPTFTLYVMHHSWQVGGFWGFIASATFWNPSIYSCQLLLKFIRFYNFPLSDWKDMIYHLNKTSCVVVGKRKLCKPALIHLFSSQADDLQPLVDIKGWNLSATIHNGTYVFFMKPLIMSKHFTWYIFAAARQSLIEQI